MTIAARDIRNFLQYYRTTNETIDESSFSILMDLSRPLEKEYLCIYLSPSNSFIFYDLFGHNCLGQIQLNNTLYNKFNTFIKNRDIIQPEPQNIEKETEDMNMPTMKFDFGPAGDNIAISPYGLAVKNKDTWITYDPTKKQTVDVTGFVFDSKNMIYKIPVAAESLRPGDMILHQGTPMFITESGNASEISAVDLIASEAKFLVPVTNMFGFNYVIKIVSFMNLNTGTPSPEQPFGNIMPLIAASAIFGQEDDSDNMNFNKLMMYSMMMGNNNVFSSMFSTND